MTGLDCFHVVHVNVWAMAEFFVQVVKFCLDMFILLPETSEMLRDGKSFPNSVAVDPVLLFL